MITLPVFDMAAAERGLERLAAEAPGLVADVAASAVLAGLFGASPYLARLALREPAETAACFAEGPEAVFARSLVLAATAATGETRDAAMAALRIAKRRAALAIAIADCTGAWPLERVTAALTAMADAALKASLAFLLREAAAKGKLALARESDPAAGTGLAVIAMGKHGAYELNYSSDIDIAVFYDRTLFPAADRGEAQGLAVKLVQGLVQLMSAVTADGYVFRTDLRLRPDAGSTQVAMTMEAAEVYYEAYGQNWERAAMIKARACAGDVAAGQAFLAGLVPFVYRRYLDYAAIEDIHSIKRQIHAHKGHGQIAVAGHDVKLGRGGIREIEFFCQTQQLILGGRMKKLREPQTLKALAALEAAGLVTAEAASEMAAAYRFLRTLEHRLQMINDEQTHTLPKDPAELARVAAFMGFDGAASFEAALRGHLTRVQGHYARLFEQSESLADDSGSLVFTGVDEDPETLRTLAAMGFKNPASVSAAIRGWHHGRVRATRSARAREKLTKLMPALLRALAAEPDPDLAFLRFDAFLARLPSSVQLFSLLLANPGLLETLAGAVGASPRLSEHLARHPQRIDALLDPAYLTALPSDGEAAAIIAAQVSAASSFEAALDAVRRTGHEQQLRVALQFLRARIDAAAAGEGFSGVAAACIAALLPWAEAEVAREHGRVPGGASAVLGLGKLGGREMTAASDLDLVLLYDHPEGAHSNGARPLAASQWYARAAQRLVAALTALTSEGRLYEVDMRLRPSGSKGPVATSLEGFRRYQAAEAWTWEHMALTRARVVAETEGLGGRVQAAIREALASPRDAAKTLDDVRAMRERLLKEHGGGDPWDIKQAAGGQVEVEFIAQGLMLVHAAASPEVVSPSTATALRALAAVRALPPEDASRLIAANALYGAMLQALRLTHEGRFRPEDASAPLALRLARAAGVQSFAEAESRLRETQAAVRAIFVRVIGDLG